MNPAPNDMNPPRWHDVHPDFDGHLARPVAEMTDGERLRVAWEGTLLLHWARRATIAPAGRVGGEPQVRCP